MLKDYGGSGDGWHGGRTRGTTGPTLDTKSGSSGSSASGSGETGGDCSELEPFEKSSSDGTISSSSLLTASHLVQPVADWVHGWGLSCFNWQNSELWLSANRYQFIVVWRTESIIDELDSRKPNRLIQMVDLNGQRVYWRWGRSVYVNRPVAGFTWLDCTGCGGNLFVC